jgi:hypothetical protein
LTIDDLEVGHTNTGADGRFSTGVNVGDLGVGQYNVDASCGTLLSAPIDVVLASSVDPDTSTMVILIFFLIAGLGLFRRQMRSS